eukprot:TRINITY_DN1528_c0_g1_i2.p2 TRINITY_DN1528_c0_g1~~TRINITY_DN1528_c0_g1_i2.p2  ORF type:complete len:317 (+),score=27.69 TRINITY_DN1528_c0_g1_i2:181-1131(+)
MLIVAASIGLSLYYPLQTFLYPNIQFLSKACDIKYDTTFVVIFSQVKLILAGFSSFFPLNEGITFQLVGTAAFMIVLGVLNQSMKPNQVKVMVPWETAGFLSASWMACCGLFVKKFGNGLFGAIAMACGILMIAIVTLCVVLRKSKKVQHHSHDERKSKLIYKEFLRMKMEAAKRAEEAKHHEKLRQAEENSPNSPDIDDPTFQEDYVLSPDSQVADQPPTFRPRHRRGFNGSNFTDAITAAGEIGDQSFGVVMDNVNGVELVNENPMRLIVEENQIPEQNGQGDQRLNEQLPAYTIFSSSILPCVHLYTFWSSRI